MDEAKLQIKRVVAQWINGTDNGYVFGFEGPPGTGKTTLVKKGLQWLLKVVIIHLDLLYLLH